MIRRRRCRAQHLARKIRQDPHEINYWLPIYIKSRDTRQIQDLVVISPQSIALVKSQDKIVWRNFIEGRLSRNFYEM